MAAARLDIPTLLVIGGYQACGALNGETVDIEDVFESVGKLGTGELSVADIECMSRVAVAGPVPFVALMAGPFGARMAAGAAAGALIVMLADLLARASLPGLQLPVGVATGLLGAPYLLWRLSREMDKGDL